MSDQTETEAEGPLAGADEGETPSAFAEPTQTAANRQTRDAVQFANAEAFARAREAVAAIAAQGIAQAAVQTTQDAAAYLQAVMTLAATAQGVAFAALLKGDQDMIKVIEAANAAVVNAKVNFDAVAAEAAELTADR